MSVGNVIGPFDRLIIVNTTSYRLSEEGLGYVSGSEGIGENRKTVSFGSSSPVTVTLPPGLLKGFNCILDVAGSGGITVTAIGGVVLNGVTNGIAASTAQYQQMFLQSVDMDKYILTVAAPVSTHS